MALCLALALLLVSSHFTAEPVLSYETDWSQWQGVAGGPPDKDPNLRADKINEKFEKVHGNLEKFLNTAISSDQIFDANQVQYFKNQKNRSKKAKDRFHKEDGFKQVGRKNNFNKKERNKDEYDPNAFDEFEGALDDLNDVLVDANTELSNANHAKAMFMALAKSNGTDKCQELQDFTLGFGIASAVVRQLAIVAEGLYNCTDACVQQVSFGFNASTFAFVFAAAAGVLDMAATGLEDVDQMWSSELQSACLNQIDNTVFDINDTIADIEDVTAGTSEDVNDLAQAVDRLNSALYILTDMIEDVNDLITLKFSEQNELLNLRFDTVEALLNTRFDDVEILLNTPHGRRPGLPK